MGLVLIQIKECLQNLLNRNEICKKTKEDVMKTQFDREYVKTLEKSDTQIKKDLREFLNFENTILNVSW